MLEQGQERQSEDREVVALDLLEQMNPGSLQLVCADAGGNRIPGDIEVTVEKSFRKSAQGEPRHRHVAERDRSVAADRHSRMQLMSPSPERQQLIPSGRAIGGLGKPLLAECQR